MERAFYQWGRLGRKTVVHRRVMVALSIMIAPLALAQPPSGEQSPDAGSRGDYFEFSNLIPSRQNFVTNKELVRCTGDEAKGYCSLARTSFGGARILHSTVAFKDGYINTILITIPSFEGEDAMGALQSKYGKPDNVDVVQTGQITERAFWWYFLDGTLIFNGSDDKDTRSLMFVSNRKTAPVVDF